jgi:predicted phage baseplate assembly protein
VNRPGLVQLSYRVGTHATFFDTMQARLSSKDYPELMALKTREKGDPSMALLDAWATVGDVLTFYQERIANEGYLRTATERRTVLELARLIGYGLRPGVAASVYLAYSLDKDAAPVEIPEGARANSVPAPGEQMQAFETAEVMTAHVEWNAIKPRLTQPQTAEAIRKNGLYFKGTASNVKPNDPLLIDFGDGNGLQCVRIDTVEPDSDHDRTRIVLRLPTAAQLAVRSAKTVVTRFSDVARFDVSADSAMAKRVLAAMKEVATASERGPDALAAHLEQTTLPELKEELQIASEKHFTKLAPWVEGLIGELGVVRDRAATVTGAPAAAPRASTGGNGKLGILGGVIKTLKIPPSVPPASAKQLSRDVGTAYGQQADTIPRLLTTLQPALQGALYVSWKNLPPPVKPQIVAHALRVAAAPFGHNAPLQLVDVKDRMPVFAEWTIDHPQSVPRNGNGPIGVIAVSERAAAPIPDYHKPRELYLDNEYDLAPDSLVVIEKSGSEPIIIDTPAGIVHRSLAAYGLSGKTVQINLPADKAWLAGASGNADEPDEPFSTVRNTRVFAGSEKLTLAEEPMTDDVADSEIELGDLYADLDPGRWLIVAGERTDIRDSDGKVVAGVTAAELVMLAAVAQKVRVEEKGIGNAGKGELKSEAGNDVPVVGDTVHTFLTLAKPLAYTYKRESVKIYGNVVKATHGETRQEVLGGGDATKAFQQFTLKQPPLTYVSAPTVSGVESTLAVRVNDVQWHEVDSLAGLGPNDRKFLTRTDDEARTSVVFGNGERGARLPTGQENVKATYRNGIGKPGNVKAGQITLLSTRPLGVKEVINPIRASGGADKEGRDQARKNAPLAVMALDRLVSTQDYADFARTFAAVAKAVVMRLTDRRRQVVQITIAGADDIPIEPTSDVYRNLYGALHRFGDPYQPIHLTVRERLALVVSAKVRIDPDYQWDTLEPKIRAAVLERFSFERLELGEDLLRSDAIKVMQGVTGVLYVDVDVFDAISESRLLQGFTESAAKALQLKDRIMIEPARLVLDPTSAPQGRIVPAQLAYLAPEVPDTLLLQELKP